MTERGKPKPEEVARVAAARALAGLPEDAQRSREIAAELFGSAAQTRIPEKSGPAVAEARQGAAKSNRAR